MRENSKEKQKPEHVISSTRRLTEKYSIRRFNILPKARFLGIELKWTCSILSLSRYGHIFCKSYQAY